MQWIFACLIAPLLFIVTVPSSSLIDCLQSKGEEGRQGILLTLEVMTKTNTCFPKTFSLFFCFQLMSLFHASLQTVSPPRTEHTNMLVPKGSPCSCLQAVPTPAHSEEAFSQQVERRNQEKLCSLAREMTTTDVS